MKRRRRYYHALAEVLARVRHAKIHSLEVQHASQNIYEIVLHLELVVAELELPQPVQLGERCRDRAGLQNHKS